MIGPLVVVVGAVFIAVGVATYAGWWRGWASPGRGWYAPGFGILYAGAAMALAGVLVLVGDAAPRAATIAGIVVMTALFATAILSLFWFPAFLTPRWFRDQRGASKSIRRWGPRP
ncbi:hypothetical protein AB1K54_01870 [Microbacterium sp. BWT-B31]|uniref:hypothetical protein n=1 Tax=Microbacterium sp. BWT-B31 TaxID=3232072 RepID=UPI0035293CFF